MMKIVAALSLTIAAVALIAWPASKFFHLTFDSAAQSITMSDASLTILTRRANRETPTTHPNRWTIERAAEQPPDNVQDALAPANLLLSMDRASFFIAVPLLWIALAALCVSIAAWTVSRAKSVRQFLLIGGAFLSSAAGAAWAFSLTHTVISEQTRTDQFFMVDAGRLMVSRAPPKARFAQLLNDVVGSGDASRLFVAARNTFRTNAPRMSLWKPQFGANPTSQQRRYYLPLWMPFAAFSAATLMLALTAFRKRPAPGHCKHCNYNLTGNQSNKCPECGTPTKSTASPNPPPPAKLFA